MRIEPPFAVVLSSEFIDGLAISAVCYFESDNIRYIMAGTQTENRLLIWRSSDLQVITSWVFSKSDDSTDMSILLVHSWSGILYAHSRDGQLRMWLFDRHTTVSPFMQRIETYKQKTFCAAAFQDEYMAVLGHVPGQILVYRLSESSPKLLYTFSYEGKAALCA